MFMGVNAFNLSNDYAALKTGCNVAINHYYLLLNIDI